MSNRGYYYQSRCRVCNSPHIPEYHRLKLIEGYSYWDLEKYSKDISDNHGKGISHSCFHTHFKKHVKPYMKATYEIEAAKFTDDFIKNKLKEEQEAITRIQNNLERLDTLLNELLQSPQLIEDVSKLRILKELLSEVRLTQEAFFRMRSRYIKETVVNKDETYVHFRESIKDCCPKCIKIIIDNLKKLGYE